MLLFHCYFPSSVRAVWTPFMGPKRSFVLIASCPSPKRIILGIITIFYGRESTNASVWSVLSHCLIFKNTVGSSLCCINWNIEVKRKSEHFLEIGWLLYCDSRKSLMKLMRFYHYRFTPNDWSKEVTIRCNCFPKVWQNTSDVRWSRIWSIEKNKPDNWQKCREWIALRRFMRLLPYVKSVVTLHNIIC